MFYARKVTIKMCASYFVYASALSSSFHFYYLMCLFLRLHVAPPAARYSIPLLCPAAEGLSLCPTGSLARPADGTAFQSVPGGRRADLHMRGTIMERNNDAISGEELSLIAVRHRSADRKLVVRAKRGLTDRRA